MRFSFLQKTTILVVFASMHLAVFGINLQSRILTGHVELDDSWGAAVYLCHIPSFDDMYSMSPDMILSKADIDSLGKFSFDISFLPSATNLYRLHIAKKEDTPTALLIGSTNENHLFLLANRNSKIHLDIPAASPPFRYARFEGSRMNTDFQFISRILHETDSVASQSSAVKRKFVKSKMMEELQCIADSSSIPLVSLYALYNTNIETNASSQADFYSDYLEKWKSEENAYFEAIRKQLDYSPRPTPYAINILFGLLILGVGILLGRYLFRSNRGIKKLSVQERKIFELLKQGATNQDISDEFNIGISTVKSHVSSILGKLKVKSRKEILDIQ